MYSYEATCKGELTIEAGEIISAISKDTGSDYWWTGTGKHGTGQFPSTYIKLNGQSGAPKTPQVKKVRALYDFVPASAEELGFKAGDVLLLKHSEDTDWWEGEFKGKTWAFPASCKFLFSWLANIVVIRC